MWGARILGAILALALLAGSSAAGFVTAPSRADRGSNFHLLVGVESLDLHLDPRGSDAFTAANLVPRADEGGLFIGVGWVFHQPLRLGLTAGGWRTTVDRPDVTCTLARAAAELHVALLESRVAALEATFSTAALVLNYDGLGEFEAIPGYSAGVGATGRLKLFWSLGLGVTYQYQLGRFQSKTFQIDDGEPFRVHPTARLHGLRVTVYVDL